MEELISKSLIEILVKSNDKIFDIETLLDDTEPTMDNYSFALVTLITESARRNWSEQDLKEYLVQVIPDQNEKIVKSILEKYEAHKETIGKTLGQIITKSPKLVNFKWRVYHEVYSSYQGKISQPRCIIQLELKDSNQDLTKTQIICCHLDEMQDLVSVLKDACNNIKRHQL